MATTSSFVDPEFTPKGRVDAEFNAPGRVDAEFPATTGSAVAEGFAPQTVVGTRGVRQQAQRWRAAALVAASLIFAVSVEAAPNVQGAQPETWTQPVQGVSALRQADQRVKQRVGLAQQYYQATSELVTVAPPETWTSPIEGLRALGQQQRVFTQRAVQIGTTCYWTADDLTTGPLAVQPDTWTQPVQGTANLTQQARAWQRLAVSMGRVWQTPEDVTTEPDTWTQAIAGTSALRQQASLQRIQRVRNSPLWQTLPEDSDGPLSVQPDSWPQAVQGLSASRASAQAFRSRAGQTSLYWATAQDPPPLVPPDQWTQPVSGTGALRLASQQSRARAGLLSPLLWQTPEDVSGPLATPPETWTQPVSGTSALATAKRLGLARAGLAQSLSLGATDALVAIEPDTWTSPVEGQRALAKAQRQWAQRAVGVGPFYWQASDLSTGPLATQPETWVPPIPGTTAQAIAHRLFRGRAAVARALAQTTNDVTAVLEPDTWTQPIAGLSALGQQQRAWSQRVSRLSPRLYWQTPDLTPGALAVQPETWQPPISGIRALRTLQQRVRAVALRVGSFLWQLPPQDESSTPIGGDEDGTVAADLRVRVPADDLVVQPLADDLVVRVPAGEARSVAYDPHVLVDGAVGAWPLADAIGAGSAIDVADSHPGTPSALGVTFGQPALLSDGRPSALFDGIERGTDAVPNPSRITSQGFAPIAGTAAFTWEAWARPQTLFPESSIAPYPVRLVLATGDADHDSSLGFHCSGGIINPPTVVPHAVVSVTLGGVVRTIIGQDGLGPAIGPGDIYHLVATYDGATLLLYVNGVVVNTLACSGSFASSSLWIGANGLGNTDPDNGVGEIVPRSFNGWIGKVAVYPTALTPAQIATHYTLGISGGGVETTVQILADDVVVRVPADDERVQL